VSISILLISKIFRTLVKHIYCRRKLFTFARTNPIVLTGRVITTDCAQLTRRRG
jgi:hypothetical protein